MLTKPANPKVSRLYPDYQPTTARIQQKRRKITPYKKNNRLYKERNLQKSNLISKSSTAATTKLNQNHQQESEEIIDDDFTGESESLQVKLSEVTALCKQLRNEITALRTDSENFKKAFKQDTIEQVIMGIVNQQPEYYIDEEE